MGQAPGPALCRGGVAEHSGKAGPGADRGLSFRGGQGMTGLEERIVELESRLAFQDDTLQALNDELVRQQGDIERLQLLVGALSQRQAELQAQLGLETDDGAPPPQY